MTFLYQVNKVLYILLLNLLTVFSVSAQLYTFGNYGHEQGLEMSSIQSIVQTEDGMLWIGTDGAEIYQFDGTRFTSFDNQSNYLFHHVSHFMENGGNISFGSRFLGYFDLNTKNNKLVKLDAQNIKGEPNYVLKNDRFSLFISNCSIYLENSNGNSKKLEFNNCDLNVTQLIRMDSSTVILSNHGMFYSDGNAIILLHKWLQQDLKFNDYQFGYFSDSKLTLFNSKGSHWLEIVEGSNASFYSIREFEQTPVLHDADNLVDFNYNPISKKGAAISSEGYIYELGEKSALKYIINNNDEWIKRPRCTYVDRNGSIWIGTSGFGLYKLSLEPFTKLRILEDYTRSDISFPFRSKNGEIVMSYFNGETHVMSSLGVFETKKYNFTVNGIVNIGDINYLATNVGLKVLKEKNQGKIENIGFNNKVVNLVYTRWNKLFVNIAGEGLYISDLNNGVPGDFKILDTTLSSAPYIYTAQDLNRETILFGSNEGFFSYHKNSSKLVPVKVNYKKWGGYSGVSAKDKYGNCWFTLDRAIVCFLPNGESVFHDATKLFKSNLLYTLQSDEFGNLFLGTNKGIFRITVDRTGEIKHFQLYNKRNGFDGLETNMRAQFTFTDGLYVATINGLYKISPELFEKFPIPSRPVITDLNNGSDDSKWLQMNILNPSTSDIQYIYRIKNLNNGWLPADSAGQIHLSDLQNGNYTLEVKASYDGITFSQPGTFEFSIQKPIWRSSWFIILVLVLIVGFNVFLIRYNKAFNTTSLLDTKDTVIHLRMTPGILLFGFIAISGAHFIAPILDPELQLHFGPSLFTSVVLLSLFLLSLSSKANGTEKQYYNVLLVLALTVAQLHFLYELYVSHIHPFHLIGIILVSMVAPYVLKDLKQTVIYSIILLAISLAFVQLITNPVYSKVYFIIAIFIQACLLIFISYLRYNSIEKLLFISAIINKGNLPAIAFDKQGVILYASENISLFADTTHDQLIRKNISYLNRFVPFNDKYKETDVLNDFTDGQFYLVPMVNDKKEVRWIEWSFKQFTSELSVIIGQDVTEKMELENTYELLVQNAEDFIYKCDVEGNFTFMNNVCFEKLGYSKEELLGRSYFTIIDENFREDIASFYHDHFLLKKTTSYREFPIRTKEGALIWIGQHVTTLFAPGSEHFVKGFIALARDITDIRTQQELIIEQRDNITSSIHYAKRIQQNLLPHERMFSNLFSDHFIIYKPKDIVSGDFYWMDDIDDRLILALADCTGHGVPGSFMTLLGMNLLNMIISEDKILDPGKILDRLDERLLEILPRGEYDSQISDGMEITICSIDKKSGEMMFACAGSRFLMYKKGEFTMFKGDTKHIGDIHHDGFQSFQTNYTTFDNDDQLILFTDGFQDQFGGPNDKKYSFRRLLELFDEAIHEPLGRQKEIIEEEFDNWIGHGEQTDDLTVISLRKK